ncbi:MAG: hypothetical protein HGB36_07715 [Chlorobiaceae bacterium]|nr:hypothetical protein [Chlorobiaceae bacterium]
MLKSNDLFVIALHCFNELKKKVIAKSIEKKKGVGYFTPHDTTHYQGVKDTIDVLLKKQEGHRHAISFGFIEEEMLKDLKVQNEESDIEAKKEKIDFDRRVKNLIAHAVKETFLINKWERLFLYFCAWSHDIGMLEAFYEPYYKGKGKELPQPKEIRDQHDKISNYMCKEIMYEIFCEIISQIKDINIQQCSDYNFISENEIFESVERIRQYFSAEERQSELKEFIRSLIYIINLVSLYHRRAENIATCPKVRTLHKWVESGPIRTQLLAAIFRLSDALSVDRTRFHDRRFDEFRNYGNFDAESRLHWIKSFVVSSIELKDSEHEIEIQIDVPYQWRGDFEKKDWEERINNLAIFIKEDLNEDVISVSKILYENNFPLFLDIKSIIHTIPTLEYENEIWEVLNDLVVSSSPNTSRLIVSTIVEIEEHVKKMEEDNYAGKTEAEVQDYIEKNINAIKEQLEKRPCHLGLIKIKNILEAISKYNNDSVDILKIDKRYLKVVFLDALVRTVKFQRQETEKNAKNIINELQEINGCTDIILYGFSQLVSNVIRSISEKTLQNIIIHILECRTKTTVSRTNRLIYHDGVRYAKYLREEIGLANETLIKIYPDSYCGTLMSEMKNSFNNNVKKLPVVFFGANAVNTDFSIVHSMGHLTVAEIAKKNIIPVIVIADTMKVGKINHSISERNKDYWLTNDRDFINNLQMHKIGLSNPNEDVISSDCIDKIVLIDQQKVINHEMNKDCMIEYENKFYEEYKVMLKKTVLAGLVRNRSIDKDNKNAQLENDSFWLAGEECYNRIEDELHSVKHCEQIKIDGNDIAFCISKMKSIVDNLVVEIDNNIQNKINKKSAL